MATSRLLSTVLAAALLLGACGGESETSEPPPTSVSVLTTAPSELTTTTTTIPAGPKFHIVESGETLSAIAALYGLTLQQILDANPNITDPSRIGVGFQILVPDAPEEVDAETTLPPLELDDPEEPDLPDVIETTTTTEPLATTTTVAADG